MEGECYALIWGIMHFWQYLYQTSFVVRTDHKPLKWLATVSDPFGRRGKWISMLQDFNFKIVHRAGARFANVDALNHNLIGSHDEDEDFGVEIQDVKKNVDVAQVQKSTTLSPHIFTIPQAVDVKLMHRGEQEEINQFGEFAEQNSNLLTKVPAPKRKASRISALDTSYWGLICEAQEMVNVEINPIDVNNNEEGIEIDEIRRQMDIWKDETSMILLFRGTLDQMLTNAIEVDRAKKNC